MKDLHSIAKARQKQAHRNRIRIGSSNVKEVKLRLARHISILSPLLLSFEMESISTGNNALSEALHRLPKVIKNTLSIAIGEIIDARLQKSRIRTAKSSPMTN